MVHQKNNNKVGFEEFVDIWCTLVQEPAWDLPDVHKRIIDYLENEDDWGNNTAVLELWRGVGKSSLVALYIVWKLANNPNLLFLVLSATKDMAKKTVLDCRSIINRHPLARHLLPESKKHERMHWSSTSFTVTGAKGGREASVNCSGIDAEITGSRCNYLIFDDIEVEGTANTDDKYDKLTSSIAEASKFKTPNGKTLFIGTPWATNTIYEEKASQGASQLKIPLLENISGEFPHYNGISNWPERFDSAYVKQVQLDCKTAADFLSQYQLIPAQDASCVFDPQKLIKYDDEIVVDQFVGGCTYTLCGERIVGVSAFWDPALNRKKSDDSVLAIVFQSEKGHYYIHRTFALNGDIANQCAEIRGYVLKYGLPSITVEDNGVGASIGGTLREYLRAVNAGVVERYTRENKYKKISAVFSVPLNTKAMYVSNHVYDPTVSGSKFVSQLRSFTGSNNKGADDYIDAVAMAMMEVPVRLGLGTIPFDANVDTTWQGHTGGFDYAPHEIEW